jgi:1-acyl-sn-glycerol-3-phosphate acyltransferase
VYTILRAICRLLVRVYLVGIHRISGAENVPREGPLLICSNHPSTVDPVVLPAFVPRGDTWSMAKSEWFEGSRFVARAFGWYHAFPVVRHSPDRRGLRRAREVLEQGGALLIYPEGERWTTGEAENLQPAQAGAGFLARITGAPVLPVAIIGTNLCFPRGAFFPRRRRVELRFGTPVRVRDLGPDGRRIGNQDAADAIMLAIARLLPPDLRGAYADEAALEARVEGILDTVP